MTELVLTTQEALYELTVRAVRAALAESAPTPQSPWMDARGASEYVGRPVSSIYKLTSTRGIPFHRNGSLLRFDRRELDRWMRCGA